MPRLPLDGVRVWEQSTSLAGRLAALLLADQGAAVFVRARPGPSALDEYLDRGKHLSADDAGSCAAAEVVVVDGAATVTADPRQIVLRITTVLPGDDDYDLAEDASDDLLNALVGFYTDLHVTGRLLGHEVVYTPLPLCSVYAGVLAALAIAAALFDRQRGGAGRTIIVARLAAGLAAIGVLALKIEGLPHHLAPPALLELPEAIRPHIEKAKTDPAHFEWLKRRLNPLAACYRAADGRLVMPVAAVNRRIARRMLEVLHIWPALVADGLVDRSPYDAASLAVSERNIARPQTMGMPLRLKLAELLEQTFAGQPAAVWEERLSLAGVPCAVLRHFDEWFASDQARQAGLVDPVVGLARPQLGRAVRLQSAQPYPALRAAAPESAAAPPFAGALGNGRDQELPLAGLIVIDCSNVIAGPSCGRALAELGADVIKVDAVRPDHQPLITITWAAELNQGKRSILVDLHQGGGRQVFAALIGKADVVIANSTDDVLGRMELDEAGLWRHNPSAILVQVTAFKGQRASGQDEYPGYDPLLQAATGIMTRFGSPELPELHGLASCVDYLTGYLAAFGAATAAFARQVRGGDTGDRVETSLASAASLVQLTAQFPELAPRATGQEARGRSIGDRLYRCADGWIFAEAGTTDIGDVSAVTVSQALHRLKNGSIAAVPVQSVAGLRDRHAGTSRGTIRWHRHQGACPTEVLAPSWFHIDGRCVPVLSAPPSPGTDSRRILADLGLSADEIDSLIAAGAVSENHR